MQGLRRAGIVAGSEAGRLCFVDARWFCIRCQGPLHKAHHATYVGRTHTIVRLETRIRRKDGTENFGGFVYMLDGFPQMDFVL